MGDDRRNSIRGQGWKLGVHLGLDAHLWGEWEGYVNNLHKDHIHLFEEEDSLIWEKSPDGRYSPKAGYSSICVDIHNQVIIWWWRCFWKLHCLAKSKLLWWAILEDKVPTWDNLQKRSFEGSG